MKNRVFIIAIACCACLFAACRGDHSARVVRDTVGNRYGVDTAKTEKSNIDTSRVKSEDNSASGGTKIVKDTSKK